MALKIAHTEPLASFLDHSSRDPDLDHQLHLKSNAELVEVIKDRVETVYHVRVQAVHCLTKLIFLTLKPTSSCRMAPLEKDGVVDSKLRVYGIRGLRICDASIFPFMVSGHTVRKFDKLQNLLTVHFRRLVHVSLQLRNSPTSSREICYRMPNPSSKYLRSLGTLQEWHPTLVDEASRYPERETNSYVGL